MTRVHRALIALLICLLAASTTAAGESSDSFIEVTGSDFIDWCDDTMCLMPDMELYYTRVDGISYSIGLRYLNDERLHPRVSAVRGWMSAREEESYRVEFEQPFHSQESFSLGVQFYDETAWNRQDAERVSDLGNNMNAFLARVDHRDYFRREGVTLFANMIVSPELEMRLEFRNDELSSLEEKQSVWSVFGRDDDWRENPELAVGIQDNIRPFEGQMKSYVGSVVYDSRNQYTHSGWLACAFLEFAGSSTGGDYDFRKYSIELRHLMRVSSSQTLDLTASWGIGSGTDYPSHKLFTLGGPNDLRGYDYKSFSGKNMVFGRAEYGVDLWPDPVVRTVFFVDSGSVWYSGGDISPEFKYDFGIGFRVDAPALGDIRIDVARAATTDDSDVFVYVDLHYW